MDNSNAEFMAYLVSKSRLKDSQHPNRDSIVLFQAIQDAFSSNTASKPTSVHPHFLRSLAVSNNLLLMSNRNKPVRAECHEIILGCFVDALILAVQQGKVRYKQSEEKCWINNLVLPPTFVVWARTVRV